MSDHLASLALHLIDSGPVAVAVSGGVDSMTLATLAHRVGRGRVEMYHAVSPAVPPEATERVRSYAAREGWELNMFDADEFRDADYVSNPVNRCYFCKTHLYGAIAGRTSATVLSGTNTDDLGDYRPGLRAAENFNVRHPYVEVGIDKSGVRGIARELGLADVADLPAAPCLASRIETGIAVAPLMLTLVNRVERDLTDLLHPEVVRCRIRAAAITVELDEATLGRMSTVERENIQNRVAKAWRGFGKVRPVELLPYRRGSAFLHLSASTAHRL
jgi:uncharacterized protein